MAGVPVIISMLHEGEAGNSAARMFRDRPVLGWTLKRLGQARGVDGVTILCWADQASAVRQIARARARVVEKARVAVPSIDQISAAQRWSDGWRGGLLGTCHFDRGFHGPSVLEAMAGADAAVLVDPAAALVDAELVDGLIEHAQGRANREIFFTQAAPGLGGVLVRRSAVERLAKANAHPGKLLAYSPDLPGLDPVTNDMCFAAPPAVTRTLHRFSLDSDRQVARISAATAGLNGELISTGGCRLVELLDARGEVDNYPREIVLELTARRAVRPIFSPGTHLELGRGEMTIETVRRILEQVSGVDDLRLTLGGAGDPVLHSGFGAIVRMAAEAGIRAVHVESDWVDVSEEGLSACTSGAVDVASIHLPAAKAETYRRVMGVDAMAAVIDNLRRLLSARRALPLIVPTFMKCQENLEEMEVWYDHWIRVLGHAVIAGPGDFAGQIPDCAVADMSPPRRRPCGRLKNRMTILSDGTVASCEQDVLGRQAMGHVLREPLKEIWGNGFASIRDDHACGRFAARPLCGACREWHRP
jgi:radical SAM protein with 4Fe4S-binding SPASM domain